MKIAIIGCGYVADLYLKTLALHPTLELVGTYDKNPARLAQFTDYYKIHAFPSFEELLASNVELVLNLTNPDSHYDVSMECLKSGKNVYSEKPLAMLWDDARRLYDLAKSENLILSSAPCSVLGEAAQTLWKAIRARTLGSVYAVYAEMDDGLVHRMPYHRWRSASGAPWPAEDEFSVGCTLEHAGYVLSWLCALFGPATSVTAFGCETIPDKVVQTAIHKNTPDLTIAALQFKSGVVARLTCSIVGEHDHRLRVFCEKGILGVHDTWHYRSKVWQRKYFNIRRKTILSPWRSRIPLCDSGAKLVRYGGSSCMDFCRGPAEIANALKEKRNCRLSNDFSLHVNEISLAISDAREFGLTKKLESSFSPMEPMPWAT